MKNHWTDLQGYFGDAWDAMRARESGGTAEGVLWAVVPHLLREMGTGTSDEAIALNELASELEVSDVVGWPVAALGGHRHATSINLPHLLAACCEALATMDGNAERRFKGALDQLAKEPRRKPKLAPERPGVPLRGAIDVICTCDEDLVQS